MEIIPLYEVVHKPWFGPRKRAREHLERRKQILSPIRTLSVLNELLGKKISGVQFVRFIDYIHKDKYPFRYTIVLIWTASDHKLREMLYNNADDFVKNTGWYPLPIGERIESRKSFKSFRSSIERSNFQLIPVKSPLLGLENAVGPDGGCSIRLRTSNGSILLDTGLPFELNTSEDDKMVLLSHFHLDHFGGIQSNIVKHLPLVMSRGTAQVLLGLERLSPFDLKARIITIPLHRSIRLGDGLEIQAFRVPHCPGSTGFRISDERTTVFYTGDICLQSNRHNFFSELLRLIKKAPTDNIWALLDATMAGRTYGASSKNIAYELIQKLDKYKDILIISGEVERLFYAYLDLFWVIKNHPEFRFKVDFIMSPSLKLLFQVIHSAFIVRELKYLDPFLLGQYGKNMSSWAESRWLYWVDEGISLSNGAHRIWFIAPDEIKNVKQKGLVGVIRIGKFNEDYIRKMQGRLKILDLDTSPWSLHSNEDMIKEIVQQISSEAKVVLFHNYPNRLKKFSRKFELHCEVISHSKPIQF